MNGLIDSNAGLLRSGVKKLHQIMLAESNDEARGLRHEKMRNDANYLE